MQLFFHRSRPDHQTNGPPAALFCTSPIQPPPGVPTTHHPPPPFDSLPHATPPCRRSVAEPRHTVQSSRLSQQLGTRTSSASTGKRGRRPPRCRSAIQFGRDLPPRSTSPSQTRQSSRHGRQLRHVRQGLRRPKRSRALPHGRPVSEKGWGISLRAVWPSIEVPPATRPDSYHSAAEHISSTPRGLKTHSLAGLPTT